MKQVFRLELHSEDGVSAARLLEIVDAELPFVRQWPGYKLVVEGMEDPPRHGAQSYQRAAVSWSERAGEKA